MRTFEYRLYPNKEQRHLLMQCLMESRGIYNGMLEMVKIQYEQEQTFPSKYELEAVFKGQGEHVPATTVQMLADRLTKSLKRFLAAKKNDIPGIGFPRFKKPNRWHSIQLRQYGKDVYLHEDKKHLIIPAKMGKSIKIKLHRPIGVSLKQYILRCVLMGIGMPSSSARHFLKLSISHPPASILTSGLM